MRRYYIFFAVLTLIVGAASFVETKSSREPLKDQQKETDISQLQNAVDAYARKNYRLPDKLSELELEEKLRGRLGDYEYKTTSSDKYEICATFKTDTSKGQPSSSLYSDDFSYPAYHKKGRQCFSRTSYNLSDLSGSSPSGSAAGSSLVDLYGLGNLSDTSDLADDTERQTDIKALHGQIEVYYTDYGFYPTLANINDSSWRSANMKGLDKEALKDPKGSKYELAASPSSTQYGYAATNANGGACDNEDGEECVEYTLSARLQNGTTYTKTNLN